MTGFVEERLSDRIAYQFRAEPKYDTSIAELENGKEYRQINLSECRRSYNGSYDNFNPDQLKGILAFFHAMYGSGYGFRFKDFTDFEVIADVNGDHGVAPAGSTPLQLQKVYKVGAQSNTRIITKPVSGTVHVFQDTGSGPVEKAGTTDYTTGIFTPTTAWTPGAIITATFEFDVPVRFTNDSLPAVYADYTAINIEIQLIEIDPLA